MRIALVTPYSLDVPGGVGTHVLGLARWLRAEGHDPFVVAPGERPIDAGVPVRLLGRTIPFSFNGSTARLAVFPAQARAARAAVATADVVHVHEPLTPGVALAAARVGRPLVVTHHAAFTVGPLRPLLRARAALLPRDRVSLAVSEAAAATALAATDVRPLVVPNAVEAWDLSAPTKAEGDRACSIAEAKEGVAARSAITRSRRFARRSDSRNDAAPCSFGAARETARPLVLFVGRDEPRKGFPVFAELARSGISADFVAVGPSAPTPGVTVLGPVSDADRESLLSWASVLVAPNLAGESFGLVLVEALAHGAAVLASDLPAFRAVADDPAVIRFFPPGDAPSAAAGLRRFLTTLPAPSDAQAAAAPYTWDAVGPHIARAYARTLGSHGIG
ncbi:glycosyltransferase family 4 protein [Tessaracoccus sp.]|uniref:glycosyltransferase family 4 protein n=1 Tax=Tessaracoccus sp. TaxID=1971211 RepID=UPI002637FFC1|nr:glycosyltransferase family 4 protein [Tessaracoccus sp.]